MFWKVFSSCWGADLKVLHVLWKEVTTMDCSDLNPKAIQQLSCHGVGQENDCAYIHVHIHTHIRQETARAFSELFQQCFDFYSLTHSSHLMRIWGFLLSSHLGNWADYFPVGASDLYLAQKWYEVALNCFSFFLKSRMLQNTGGVKQGDIKLTEKCEILLKVLTLKCMPETHSCMS